MFTISIWFKNQTHLSLEKKVTRLGFPIHHNSSEATDIKSIGVNTVLSRQRLDLFEDFGSLDVTYHTLGRQITQPTFVVKTPIITKKIKK